METIYFSKWILGDSGDILINGAMVTDGCRIKSIGPRSRVKRSSYARIVNLGDVLLMPGLINMHTHLEASVVRGSIKPFDETFAAWSAKVNSRIRTAPADNIRSGIQLSIRELIAQGITSIADSSRFGHSIALLEKEPIRSWVIHELHSDEKSLEKVLFDNCTDLIRSSSKSPHRGIGPHALFSISPETQHAAIHFANDNSILWLSHVAESAEELQAFSEKSGDLFFHATRKQPWLYNDAPGGSMSFALENGLIPHGGICVHCNYVNGTELEKLAALDASVVLCYTYTREASHKQFPLDVALKRNCNICLGTEGIAAHGAFSIFDELFALKQSYPHIAAKDLLKMPTCNAAKALKMENELGTLTEGKLADFIAVRFSYSQEDDLLETLLIEEPEIVLVVINGEEIVVNY